MAQDNNQPAGEEKSGARLQGFDLQNFIFMAETLEKKFMLGDVFTKDLYAALARGEKEFDLTNIVAMNDTGKLVQFKPEFGQVESREHGQMTSLLGIRSTLLDKDAQPIQVTMPENKEKVDLSQYYRVFMKTGFTANEMRNSLEGRSVLFMAENKQRVSYPAYDRLNFSAQTDSGNFKRIVTPESRLDLDIPLLLSKAGIPRDWDEKSINEKIKQLQSGEMISTFKRKGGEIETTKLYLVPHENALAAIRPGGHLEMIQAPKIQVSRYIPEPKQNTSQDQAQTGDNQQRQNAAAAITRKINEKKNKTPKQNRPAKRA